MFESVAPGVWQLTGRPRHAVNCHLLEDVLVDAGTRFAARRIIRTLRDRPPRLVALTHAHPDHHGGARAVCRAFSIPLACHALDAPAVDGRARMEPRRFWMSFARFALVGAPHPVDRLLEPGDLIAGFRVIHAPGHTSGHVLYFRDHDRTAVIGDVLVNIHWPTLRERLAPPPSRFCVDALENYHSILKLAELEPRLVCFGHGPPLRDTRRLHQIADRVRRRAQALDPAPPSVPIPT